MFLGSFLAKKYSPKLIIGCIGIMGPTFLWLSPLVPTFGWWWFFYLIVYAVVNGLTYMASIHHSWLWYPDKPGLASGIIMSGYGLSGFIFSNLSLVFVNPEHVSANSEGLFPESVYKNVPHMLRSLAYCYATLVVIAVFLV